MFPNEPLIMSDEETLTNQYAGSKEPKEISFDKVPHRKSCQGQVRKNDIEFLPWPPNSPHLNPIEDL